MSVRLSKGEVLLRFLAYIETEDVPYCVVGDTKQYPDQIDSDVDIVVPEKIVASCPRIVQAFAKSEDVELVQNLRHEQNAWSLVLAWRTERGNFNFITLDICGDYFHNGKRFIIAQQFLQHRQHAKKDSGEDKGFYVPAPEAEFIYYLLKKVSKGNVSTQEMEHLRNEYSKAPVKACELICEYWPKGDVEIIVRTVSEGDRNALQEALPGLCGSLSRRADSSSPRFLIKEYWRRVWRVLQPTGLMVVFIGPDGCGKSTIIAMVEQQMAPVFRRTWSYHLQPRLSRKGVNDSSDPNPHLKLPRGFVSSFVKLGYLWVDYSLGYLVKILPQLFRSTLVLFDRYYHDLLVDPKRYRYESPNWIARLIAKFTPKPDLWFLLDAKPEILQARKQEVPFEETARQREAYLDLIRSFANGVLVDASKPMVEVSGEVSQFILKHLAQRLEQRLKSKRTKILRNK